MTTDDGRQLVFDLSMSGATYPDVLTGLQEPNEDVGLVAAQIQRMLSTGGLRHERKRDTRGAR